MKPDIIQTLRKILPIKNSGYNLFCESIHINNHYRSSIDSACKFSHFGYISFSKDAFKNVKYPELIKRDKHEMNLFEGHSLKFDYIRDNDFANLDFHGGITFYEENLDLETKNIIVKAGCDYQHLGDDHYSHSDNTFYILEDMKKIGQDFIDKFYEEL